MDRGVCFRQQTVAFSGSCSDSDEHYDVGRAQAQAVGVLTYVLATVSLSPTDAILSALKQSYKGGLPAKVFVGRSCAALYSDFYEQRRLDRWKSVQHSYKPPRVHNLLTALAMLVANWRLNRDPATRLTLASDPRAHTKRLMADEKPDDPRIPASEVTVENLRTHLQLSMMSSAKTIGLEMKSATPDLRAFQDFLWIRGRYGLDDVPHPNPFDNDSLGDDSRWQQLISEPRLS